jgi:hypothetical protein
MDLTTNEKYGIGAVALVALAGTAYYFLVYKPKHAAVLPSGMTPVPPSLPQGQPAPVQVPAGQPPPAQSTGPNATIAVDVPPVQSPYTTASTGPTQYTVTTQSTGEAGQLRIRSGPGVSYPMVGVYQHGDTVLATGVLTPNPVDGYTWAQVMDGSGNITGWCATTDLSVAGPPGTVAAGNLGAGNRCGHVGGNLGAGYRYGHVGGNLSTSHPMSHWAGAYRATPPSFARRITSWGTRPITSWG